MAKEENKAMINFDGVDYAVDDMSDTAKIQLANLRFVDAQLQQLNNEWAVSDTARIGYSNALKKELAKIQKNK